MTVAPRALAEIPFERHDPLRLLNLEPGPRGQRRGAPDLDYAGFGWAELDALVLEAEGGARRIVAPALVLALHTADDPSPDATGLELALELPSSSAGEPPLVVLAPLDRFLAAWLPRLPPAAPHVVLALCNPHHLDPPRPPGLGSRTLHYAYGDVLSWLDLADHDPAHPHGQVRLHAHAWHQR